MQTFKAGKIDVAVIGAGHAGIEAALACARLGLSTALFTINLDAVGNMPCNPSIGGTGKGHLVYEIDALGGEMGFAADQVTLQSRLLNRSKGPAVHSKRVQADRVLYREIMKKTLENQQNLLLIQAEIGEIVTEEEGGKRALRAVITRNGAEWACRAAIVCAGTFLNGRVITGENAYASGPDGMLPATGLSASLEANGVRLMRFKTGTPPRIHADSIDYDKLELQEGDDVVLPFSSRTKDFAFAGGRQLPCHIAYTNERTHEIIRQNLHRSPLYGGEIKGVGPRYCPSIEDKVVRFADKERHQLFVEPMGIGTKEVYLQGFSSSMPEEVQSEMLHSLVGFEHAQVMRTAYAIEYDCADPTQLFATLEFKEIGGLYGAGQFNGTSGYEEAAAQGLIAGINASLTILGREPVVLPRSSSYIGTLIDDLVTKGTNEPYRMMTSRSEYRLLLRQDNADERLIGIGHDVGLVDETRYAAYLEKAAAIEREQKRIETTNVPPSPILQALLDEKGSTRTSTGIKLSELMRRPELDYDALAPVDPNRPDLPRAVKLGAEIRIKYGGYIKRQLDEAEKFKKLESKLLPPDIDYEQVKGIRIEAMQKLQKFRPASIGQASRISGISPADITVLLIYLSQKYGERE
ncbi:MAG: tRNA uridine-5-carboxymethylaminomethyl(34) synthesis enzyme MnmG [Ruminococcaceae bacterium]|nr:tRNA uridine-5-carboxymethylaminomethyl(34) synthesis enzyme MnmG [Oscillospiraceae bacterium]